MQDAAHYKKMRIILRGIQLYSLASILVCADALYRSIGRLIVVMDYIYLDLQAKGQDRPYDFMSDDLGSAPKKIVSVYGVPHTPRPEGSSVNKAA